MERIGDTRPFGISRQALRTWGLLFAAAGIVGKGILQNRLLGMGNVTTEQLLELMQGSGMAIATTALVLQALETCAVPIFAYLLVTGVEHTSNLKNYALRITGVALLSEIPYNLALGGQFFSYPAQNPVFGLVLALVMVIFFRKYEGKQLKAVAIKILVTLAAMVWASMLRIDNGGAIVLIVCALWLTRKKPTMQNLFGAAAAMCCCLSSPFFMITPMVFLVIHFYNGEPGERNRVVNYMSYPVLLLAVGLLAKYML